MAISSATLFTRLLLRTHHFHALFHHATATHHALHHFHVIGHVIGEFVDELVFFFRIFGLTDFFYLLHDAYHVAMHQRIPTIVINSVGVLRAGGQFIRKLITIRQGRVAQGFIPVFDRQLTGDQQ